MIRKKKEDKEEKLYKGTTIIKEELMSKEECETILGGKYIDDIGCVVEEEELNDGSKVFRQPPLKVIKKRKIVKKEEEEPIVEKEPE